jgi:hypothetical protein
MSPQAQAQAVFVDYLPRLRHVLVQAQRQLPPAVWAARLAPDMLPLLVQFEVAVNLALRTHAALQGGAVDWGPDASTPEGALRRLDHALSVWQRLPDPVVAVCEEVAGQQVHRAPAEDFVTRFALPNYVFHHAMVHALLRQAGLPIGKADFDGVHRY